MLNIDLKDQVALVTGVSSGIGAGISKVLAEAGCHIAGCARSAPSSEGIRELKKAVHDHGRDCLFVQADVTSKGAIQHFVRQSVEHFGRIDILVSNAGGNVFRGVQACSDGDWAFNIDLNLRAHWLIARECHPHLAESPRGLVIIIGSNHAYHTIPGCFPYNVAKAGLTAMVQSMAIEWGPAVRVVGLAPGYIVVESHKKWFDSFPDPAAELARTIGLHPAGKLGTVEEIGGWCAFLASDYAAFATGTTMVIDGGRSAIMQD
jgi:NAD(P)-dependent dehydrogenase (short-subunit alcohol dehydrogenase family)